MTELRAEPSSLQGLVDEAIALRRENAQLRTALASRVVIEQAKGVLAERFSVPPDVAFEGLRRGARSTGTKIHDLAQEVVRTPRTPAVVARELQRLGGGGAS